MSKSLQALGLAVGALALSVLPASAQTKDTNEGISPTEILMGADHDLGRRDAFIGDLGLRGSR